MIKSNKVSSKVCVVTSYFNPCRYVSRKVNFDKFVAGLDAAGVPHFTIECAFNDDPFELSAADNVMQVRTTSVLWQKERLLNILVKELPDQFEYIAWVDCDILFNNENWANELSDTLDNYRVAQLFDSCICFDASRKFVTEPIAHSFAKVVSAHPETMAFQRYDVHGHTGYGWAMHRDIFEKVGLYEHAVSGSADHFMAHAIFNNFGFCIENALKHSKDQFEHFMNWGTKFYSEVQGSLGVVSGRIEHLWHGSKADRRYFLRMHEITDLGFNPYQDLMILEGKPLEWSPESSDKLELKQYFSNYFLSRNEDGQKPLFKFAA